MSLVDAETIDAIVPKLSAQNAIEKIKGYKETFTSFMTLDVEEELYTKTVESFCIEYAEIKGRYANDPNNISNLLEYVELLCLIISFSIHEMCYYDFNLIKDVMQIIINFLPQQMDDYREGQILHNITIIDLKRDYYKVVKEMIDNTEKWIYTLKGILDDNSTAIGDSSCPGLTDFAFGILNEKRFFKNQE